MHKTLVHHKITGALFVFIVILTAGLSLMDFFISADFIEKRGLVLEANPVMAKLFSMGGYELVGYVKGALTTFYVFVMIFTLGHPNRVNVLTALTVFVIYVYAVINGMVITEMIESYLI